MPTRTVPRGSASPRSVVRPPWFSDPTSMGRCRLRRGSTTASPTARLCCWSRGGRPVSISSKPTPSAYRPSPVAKDRPSTCNPAHTARTTAPPSTATVSRPPRDQQHKRAVGEAVVEPRRSLHLPMLVGFENHGGLTTLRGHALPLGTVRVGIGNGTADRAEGVISGHVVGTYLHGPVLALNPALADMLLGWVVGELPPLPDDTVDEAAERVKAIRLEAAGLTTLGM